MAGLTCCRVAQGGIILKNNKEADPHLVFDYRELLSEVEIEIENCMVKLETIELTGTKGSYYLNMTHKDLKSAMIKINNLKRQLYD